MRNWEVHIDTDFSLGDKVMMLATLSNAEETSEFPSFGQIMWDDGAECEISIEMIEALKLAYAIIIHKSQGSQFEGVVTP